MVPFYLWATEYDTAVRTIEEITKNADQQRVLRLANASVIIADYDLIRADFPAAVNLSNQSIDEWLLKHVGYISDSQADQTYVNTPISVTGEERFAHRPPRYGRALVYEMFDPTDANKQVGLIDAKGVGAVKPRQKDHGNGIATLGEAIREYVYEKMVNEVMAEEKTGHKTIGSYAVIDPGFNVVHEDGSQSPAGFYLRQAHHRNQSEYIRGASETKIKNALAKYGIDAAGNHQGSSSEHLLDFGHYVVRDDVAGIDPQKSLPVQVWGYDKTGGKGTGSWAYSKYDRPWVWSHELAEGWREGRANRHHVWMHFQNFMEPLRKVMNQDNPGCFASIMNLRAN
jgi:hypothetical protein